MDLKWVTMKELYLHCKWMYYSRSHVSSIIIVMIGPCIIALPALTNALMQVAYGPTHRTELTIKSSLRLFLFIPSRAQCLTASIHPSIRHPSIHSLSNPFCTHQCNMVSAGMSGTHMRQRLAVNQQSDPETSADSVDPCGWQKWLVRKWSFWVKLGWIHVGGPSESQINLQGEHANSRHKGPRSHWDSNSRLQTTCLKSKKEITNVKWALLLECQSSSDTSLCSKVIAWQRHRAVSHCQNNVI